MPTRIKEDIVASFLSEDKVGCAKCKFPSLASLWECDSWRCSSIQAYHLCAISIMYPDVAGPCGSEELGDVNDEDNKYMKQLEDSLRNFMMLHQ